MNAKQKTKIVYAAALLLLLGIVGYNIWSFYAGYCTVATLMAFSLPAKLLLSGIVIAILFLFSCKSRNRKLAGQNTCACGVPLRNNWGFCPVCGQDRKEPVS